MKLNLSPEILKKLLAFFDAKQVTVNKHLQELWSGYGEIVRLKIIDGSHESAIAKVVSIPQSNTHPKGWNTEISHLRKVKSYKVESNWYQRWSHFCDENCRVAKYFPLSPTTINESEEDFSMLILMEDLDSNGFHLRKSSLSFEQSKVCLRWLANFHATFLFRDTVSAAESGSGAEMFNEAISQLNLNPKEGLWQIGSYWHLATRLEEFDAMTNVTLKDNASLIDAQLERCEYKTLIHGDAKIANFCFSEESDKVAAVDFQYVGSGCGMKDLIYFMSSCFNANECEKYEKEILDYYFEELKAAIIRGHIGKEIVSVETKEKAANDRVTALNFDVLEAEWRELYSFAWADFCRFMQGWSPSHWKMNRYSDAHARSVIGQLTAKSNF